MTCLRLSSLWRSQRGSALPIVALGMMALMGATGIAIDMSRVQVVQSRMQNALDAAGLAVGSEISTTDINAETSKYFYANFPAHYLGTTITSGPTATPNAYNSVLTLSVSGTVGTTFMKLFNINSVTVSASSQITRQSKGMELVLVMDNTGSMAQSAGGTVSKIQAAKSAANTLLDILYGDKNTVPTLWVGVVPFSQAVNVTTDHPEWTLDDTFDWGPSPSAWMGCVDARSTSNRDVTDDPPSVELFAKYYWPDDSNNDWKSSGTISTTTNLCYHQSSCTCTNYGPCTSTTTADGVQTTVSCTGNNNNRQCNKTVITPVTNYVSPLTNTRGPNKYCPQPLQPLVAEKTTIQAAVNAMTPNGDTLIPMGMVWSWRMLSPRWRGLWGGEMDANNLPQDYNTPLMNKVVILMTDGDNTIDNSAHGAYWYLSNNKLGTTTSSTAVTTLNNRTLQICSSMKAQGIIIYTIALGTSFNSSSLSMLQSCASKPEFAFVSPTTTDLQTDFQMIGDSLANLFISQ